MHSAQSRGVRPASCEFRSYVAGALYAFAWICAAPAFAQSFPERPVTIVQPYPVSGPSDIRGTSRLTKTYKLIAQNAPPAISDTLTRVAAAAIQQASGIPVKQERQPGAASTRGTAAVARAQPDGHTLLLASNASLLIAPRYFLKCALRRHRRFRPGRAAGDHAVCADGERGLARR